MDKIRELPSTVLIISSKKQPIQNLTALWVQTSEVPNGSCQVLSAEDFSVGTENSSGTATSNNGGSSDSNGESLKNFSKTSVLFVSISFIILMVISLACLVFYYVQRFRYAHAKDRLQRRLFNAARKALTRIPTRMLKSGDAELETDCAVCIDPYQTHDVVRTLPCRHVYHKSCIDPWLLEHRTCPMCKADILKYFGFHYNDGLSSRQEDAIPGERGERGDDIEIPSDSLSPSNSFPTTTDGGSQNEHLQQIIIQSTAIPSKSTPASGNRPITAGNIIIHERPQTSSAGTSTSDDRPQRTHREHHSASAPQTRAGGSREKRGSQGQIVNLVQVRTRTMSTTRAATLRKDSQPTPVDAASMGLELHGIGPNVDDVELDLRGLRCFCCLTGELSLNLRGNQIKIHPNQLFDGILLGIVQVGSVLLHKGKKALMPQHGHITLLVLLTQEMHADCV
ncbi:hypothetical protein WR25_04507 isoform A [Diploscapter pachys]|uniref:RING-type domain-containing protein n=1 Tax=Diploscapter pachys TaxID=2018661 RepID=A0A2A2LFW3_9BILA|nr:hypothetical protein WR25_04507 isoform A [Diploscapter pachys]